MSKPAQYIRGLDGLRAIAVGLVLLAHSGTWDGLKDQDWFANYIHPLVLGENGVLIFFALSGFLITHLLLREKEQTDGINYRHFLIRRALRLLPAFAAFWLILAALTATGYYDIHPASFAFAAVYLYNFIPKHFYSTHFGLTWSLGVEEQFYLLWPLAVKWFGKANPTKAIGLITILFLTTSVIFMAIIPGLSLPDYPISANGETLNLGDFTVGRVFFPYRWFMPMGSFLLLGCCAAAYANKINQWASGKTMWLIAVSLVLFLAPWYLTVLPYFPQKLVQACGFTAFILYLFLQQESPIVRLLEWAPFRHLGKISYGLYLYSGIFLGTGISDQMYWWQTLPLAIIMTYLTALVSYFVLEKYFLGMKKRWA